MVAIKARISFLGLPAELRNAIYEIVLPENDRELKIDMALRSLAGYSLQNVVRVSRRIRAETLSVFCADNAVPLRVECEGTNDAWTSHYEITRCFFSTETVAKIKDFGKLQFGLVKAVELEVKHSMNGGPASCSLPFSAEDLAKLLSLEEYGIQAESVEIKRHCRCSHRQRQVWD